MIAFNNIRIAEAWESVEYVFLTVFIVDGGLYFAFAAFLIALGWFAPKYSVRGNKIQKRTADTSDYRREIFVSVRTIFIFSCIGTVSFWIQGSEVLDRKYDVNMFYVTLQVIALVIAHDCWFYWTHRFLHLPKFYKKWHRTHHKSVTPNPFTTLSFDWREAIVQGAFTSLCGILFSIAPIPSAIFLVIMFFRTIYGHCGVEYHKLGFVDHWFWGIFTTPTHHDLHHSGGFGSNYGLHFVFWDRLMGTEHPRYKEIFREVASTREFGNQYS